MKTKPTTEATVSGQKEWCEKLADLPELLIVCCSDQKSWNEGDELLKAFYTWNNNRRAEPQPETAAGLRFAAQEALLALAILKFTDETEQYKEIGPQLREQIIKSHDLLFDALASPQTNFSGGAKNTGPANANPRRGNADYDGSSKPKSESESSDSPAENFTQTDEEIAQEAAEDVCCMNNCEATVRETYRILAAIQKALTT